MKNFIIAGFMVLAAASAQASYLYWQVNASDLTDAIDAYNTKWSASATVSDIAGARLVQEVSGDATRSVVGAVAVSDFGTTQTTAIDVSAMGSSTYSYYIEIISLSSSLPYQQVAVSTKLTYDQLVEISNPSVVYTGSELSIPQMAAWTGGTYSASPEPTSAMLVMFGIGLLGLKRKRS